MFLHLDSFGTGLRVKEGMFQVSYFDKDGRLQKELFAPGQVKGIWLGEATSVSGAAIKLALQHGIDLVVTGRHGHPVGRFYPHDAHSAPAVQKAQLKVSCSPRAAYYSKKWLARKVAAQRSFLEKLIAYRDGELGEFIRKHLAHLNNIYQKVIALSDHPPSRWEASLRGLDGSSSRVFYYVLGRLLHKPYRFAGRSRRPAKDAFNAFLNYAFAILYSSIERALTQAGINPYLGFLHRDAPLFKSMVFDFIEPYRIDMVRVVFRLFSTKKVRLRQHVQEAEGGVLLTAPGKKLLLKAVTRLMEEGAQPLRARLEKDARLFAQALLEDDKQLNYVYLDHL